MRDIPKYLGKDRQWIEVDVFRFHNVDRVVGKYYDDNGDVNHYVIKGKSMCEKYYEIHELVRKYDSVDWKYQECQNEARDDLTDKIFEILGLCKECGQRVFGKGNQWQKE